MSAPLHELEAEFFQTMAHPVRIRVLELLSQREHAVGEMLPATGADAARLPLHLALLHREGLIAARTEGPLVYWSLASPEVAGLLRSARQILAGRGEVPEDLRGC
jgi:ArsR family transcriptional regulator